MLLRERCSQQVFRFVRLDMAAFQTAGSVDRLVGLEAGRREGRGNIYSALLSSQLC